MILLSCLFVSNKTSQGRFLSLIEWVEILLLLSYDLSPKGALFHEYHPPPNTLSQNYLTLSLEIILVI